MLSGVIVKLSEGEEQIFACYKGTAPKYHVLHRLEFDDTKQTSKFKLHYAQIKLSNHDDVWTFNLMTFSNRDEMLRTILGYAIIHPTIRRDIIFKVCNGHTVLTYCWRVRIANGSLCDFLPNISDFVIDD